MPSSLAVPDAVPREAPGPAGARPLYVFFGHHKCATGWIDGILRETCFTLGWDFRIVHQPKDFAAYGSLAALVAAEAPDVLAYTNADAAFLGGMPPHRAFHVVRDPRDVIVSGYFSHRFSHPDDDWPELTAHRERLAAVSKEEGLFLEMDFSRQFLDPMNRWDYEQPHVLELKMEALSADPAGSFYRIYEHFGLLDHAVPGALGQWAHRARMQFNILHQRGRHLTPLGLAVNPFRWPMERLPTWRLPAILDRKSFRRMAGGRKKGQEDVKSHYRKGQPGDWRNHFGPEHVAAFKARFPGLVRKLGYETGPDWDV